MKINNTAIINLLLLLIFTSCESFLDKNPLDKISENEIWSNKELAEANLADLYALTPFFDAEDGGSSHICGYLGGEFYALNKPSSWITGVVNDQGGQFESWTYETIYKLNTYIKRVKEVPMKSELVDIRRSEARFLRVFLYFEMVKRYGGIPIITENQSIDAPYDEIYVKRNSEKEVYDFISTECDEVADILPEIADQYG